MLAYYDAMNQVGMRCVPELQPFLDLRIVGPNAAGHQLETPDKAWVFVRYATSSVASLDFMQHIGTQSLSAQTSYHSTLSAN